MKNILIKLLLVLSLISFSGINYIGNTYAEGVTVIVTEKIPGSNCVPKWEVDEEKGETQMYECTVEKWFKSIMIMMWKIIKYFTYLASLWGVLFIIVNGMLYSMWGAEPSMKDDAKKRITWTLVWLVLLFLSWVILNLIAPWIYKWWF